MATLTSMQYAEQLLNQCQGLVQNVALAPQTLAQDPTFQAKMNECARAINVLPEGREANGLSDRYIALNNKVNSNSWDNQINKALASQPAQAPLSLEAIKTWVESTSVN